MQGRFQLFRCRLRVWRGQDAADDGDARAPSRHYFRKIVRVYAADTDERNTASERSFPHQAGPGRVNARVRAGGEHSADHQNVGSGCFCPDSAFHRMHRPPDEGTVGEKFACFRHRKSFFAQLHAIGDGGGSHVNPFVDYKGSAPSDGRLQLRRQRKQSPPRKLLGSELD